MNKILAISLISVVVVASLAAIAWAVLPAGTLPGDHDTKRKVLTQYVVQHRKVKVVKVIHKKAKASAVVSTAAASPSYQGSSGNYAQSAQSYERATPTAPAAASPVVQEREREDSYQHEDQRETEREDVEREDSEREDG